MKDIYIFALHLSYGGVEKAIVNMANIFCKQYRVHIMCTYQMPDAPAYELDSRVQIEYLTDTKPNKKEFLQAWKSKNPFVILKEGIKSFHILYLKKHVLIKQFQKLEDCIIITTRNEDTVLLSKYGDSSVYKISQLHHDHTVDQKYIDDIHSNYKNIDVIVALCDQLKNEISDLVKEQKNIKVITIPNFIESIPSFTLEKKEKLLVATGRLDPVKGFDRLIKASSTIFKKYPDWKLYIIGEGEEKKNLEDLISQLQLNTNIKLLGKLSSEEIEGINQKASIYCMSSFSEGLPFVLIEAFSCGVPAVAFDVRVGPRAIIDDEINGFLVEDGNESAFCERVFSLIENEKMRKEYAKQAYLKSQYFSKEHVEKMWFQLLEGSEMNEK